MSEPTPEEYDFSDYESGPYASCAECDSFLSVDEVRGLDSAEEWPDHVKTDVPLVLDDLYFCDVECLKKWDAARKETNPGMKEPKNA